MRSESNNTPNAAWGLLLWGVVCGIRYPKPRAGWLRPGMGDQRFTTRIVTAVEEDREGRAFGGQREARVRE